MGKGDRRGRVPPKGIPELKPVGSRHYARDKGGKFAAPQEDVRTTVLEARARQGVVEVTREAKGKALSRETKRAVARPLLGEPMGMVIARLAEDRDEEAALWDVWCGFTSAMRTYRLRVLGTDLNPKGQHLPLVAERVETLPEETTDLRTEEEKVEGAKESRRRWMDRLARMYGADRPLLIQAESGMGKALWEGKAPTHYGRLTFNALKRLAKVIERER